MTSAADKKKRLAISIPIAVAIMAFAAYSHFRDRRGDPVEATGAPVAADTPIDLGTYVQIESDGDWYEGVVRKVNDDGTFHVHYDGWDSRYDEDVGRDRLRLSTAYGDAGPD